MSTSVRLFWLSTLWPRPRCSTLPFDDPATTIAQNVWFAWYVAFPWTVHQVLSLVGADRPVLSTRKDARAYFLFFHFFFSRFLLDQPVARLFFSFFLSFSLSFFPLWIFTVIQVAPPGIASSSISTNRFAMALQELNPPLSLPLSLSLSLFLNAL